MKQDPVKKQLEATKELRRFAIGIAIALNVLAGFYYLSSGKFPVYLSIAAGILIVPVLLDFILKTNTLRVLNPVHSVWNVLTGIINAVVSWIILLFALVVIFGGIKAIARIRGQTFLDLEIDPSAESYWKYREPKQFDPSRYEKQY